MYIKILDLNINKIIELYYYLLNVTILNFDRHMVIKSKQRLGNEIIQNKGISIQIFDRIFPRIIDNTQ